MSMSPKNKFRIQHHKQIGNQIINLNPTTFGDGFQRINMDRGSLNIQSKNDSDRLQQGEQKKITNKNRTYIYQKKKEVTFKEDNQNQNSFEHKITENNSYATLGNSSSCKSLDLYKCILCNTLIEKTVIQLSCLHAYHENCLKDLIQSQINRNNLIIVECQCNKQVKSNIIMQYCPQFLIIILNRQLERIKANNNGIIQSCSRCNFFFINYSQFSVMCFCPNCKIVFN